jgi:hypothetical protein
MAERTPTGIEHGQNIIEFCTDRLIDRRLMRARNKLQGYHTTIKGADVDDVCAVLVGFNDYLTHIDRLDYTDDERRKLIEPAIEGVTEYLLSENWE